MWTLDQSKFIPGVHVEVTTTTNLNTLLFQYYIPLFRIYTLFFWVYKGYQKVYTCHTVNYSVDRETRSHKSIFYFVNITRHKECPNYSYCTIFNILVWNVSLYVHLKKEKLMTGIKCRKEYTPASIDGYVHQQEGFLTSLDGVN